MAVSLSKGSSVSLTKASNDNPDTPKDGAGNPTPLTVATLGLGWNPTDTGRDWDLDAAAILKKASGASDLVFYNDLRSPDGSVEHGGDNLTGAGEGDDEQIKVNLAAVPVDVTGIEFMVNIYDAQARQQDFSKVQGAFIRVVSQDGIELARYDLTQASGAAMRFAKLVRNGSDWELVADSAPVADYEQYLKDAGVNV